GLWGSGGEPGLCRYGASLYFWSFDAFILWVQLLSCFPGFYVGGGLQPSSGFPVSFSFVVGADVSGIQPCPSVGKPPVWGGGDAGLAVLHAESFGYGPSGECAGVEGGYGGIPCCGADGQAGKLFQYS